MSTNYFSEHLNFTSHPVAENNAMIQLGNYRITVFTDRLFRIEFDRSQTFEDRPTQVFWHRNMTVPFTHHQEDEFDVIETAYWKILIQKEHPLIDGLALESKTFTKTWTYTSLDKHNLLGTYRTLDGADGAVDLEQGLLSLEGITVFDDASSLTFEDGIISSQNTDEYDLYVFGYGNDYTSCIKDYYKISGKTPLIPKYVFGNWWSRYWNYTDTELENVIKNFQKRDIPLAVCIIDMDWHITDVPQELGGGWTGYTWNKDYFKDPAKFMGWLKDQGLKVSLNLHPADGIRPFDDCYEAVCKRMDIDPATEQIIEFDLTNEKFVEAYFKDIHHPLEEQGVDFWWIDWQQGTKSKMDNLDPLFALNHYHLYDGLNRDKSHYFIFSRWSGLGGHRYPIGFSGDSIITWNSLEFQPYFTSTATNVGFGWWSHDIGGHYHGKETEDLYTRWVQYGVFSPVLRLHSTKSHYHKREPWRWNKEVEYITTKYLQFRHQLVPYIHTFNHLHSQGELPLVTPLYYQYPEEKHAHKYKNQYFFGTELMVRPFTSKRDKKLNMATEKVWFKEPGWFNFFTGEYINKEGEFNFYGQLNDTNLFAKKGAIVPLATNPDEGTKDLPSALDVHIFPGKDNEFTLYEDQDHTVIPTTFTLQSTDNTLQLQVQSTNGVKEPRTLHLKFRSINDGVNITSNVEYTSSYESCTNTLVLTLNWDMNTPLTITLNSGDREILLNPYNLAQDIMNHVDLSRYTTVEKNNVGYVNQNSTLENRGWLGENNTLEEKLHSLRELDIPKKLKKYIHNTIERIL